MWKRMVCKRLLTLRFLQSLEAQHSILNGARTGLQVAIWGLFLVKQVIRIWREIQTYGTQRIKKRS